MHQVVTTLLDLAGLLLSVAALAVLAWVLLAVVGLGAWSLGGSLAVAGAGVLGVSVLIDWRQQRGVR